MMKFPIKDAIFRDLPQAYLVGGAVRDVVRGAEPLDYDVVVPSDPLRIARLMADRLQGKVIILGKERFSVHRVVSNQRTIDVTAFKGNDIEADLKARDFTINALALDLTDGRIIDHLGGMKDLQEKRVRMVSIDAFKDDPARLIRAFRMAVTMDFHIAPATLKAIEEQATAIRQVAGERVWAELELILASLQSFSALRMMAESQLLLHIIPELRPMIGCRQNRHHNADVFTHTLQAYQALEALLSDPEGLELHAAAEWVSMIPLKERVVIKLALLLHDIGKPDARSGSEEGQIHFYGHAARGADLSRRICKRLRISNRHQERIESIIRHHQRPLSLFLAERESGLRPKTLGRFFRQCAVLTPSILFHAIADDIGKNSAKENQRNERIVFYQELMGKYFGAMAMRAGTPLINGRELMKIFGLDPSPQLGILLKSIEELQMAGALKDREQAVRWAADFLNHGGGTSTS